MPKALSKAELSKVRSDAAKKRVNKGGRPSIGGRQSTVPFQAKITEEDHLRLFSALKTQGRSASQWLRDLIANIDEVQPENPVVISLKGNPCYISEQEAKALLKQLTEKLLS